MPTADLAVLTSGGDERSQLDPRTSLNQYFVEQTPGLRPAPGSEQGVGSIVAFHVLSDAAPFLRVALGASTVHELLRAGSVDLADDHRLLEIITEQAP